MAAMGKWQVTWLQYGLRGGVAGPLVAAWPPYGHGQSPGPRMDVVGAWPVTWPTYCCRWGVAGPLAPYGLHGGVAGPLSSVWPP